MAFLRHPPCTNTESMSLVQQWLRGEVQPYTHANHVYNDVDSALTSHRTVRPKTDVYSAWTTTQIFKILRRLNSIRWWSSRIVDLYPWPIANLISRRFLQYPRRSLDSSQLSERSTTGICCTNQWHARQSQQEYRPEWQVFIPLHGGLAT